MSDENQWRRLPENETLEFLSAVSDESVRIFFEPTLCEVFSRPLDFFDGYDLIRISNQYAPPFVLLDYISNGENHFYLDGSDHAFQTLCKQNCLRLHDDNVLEYIDMYFTYVYERGNSIVFIRDAADTNFKGSDAIGVHFKALQKVENIAVQWDEVEEIFIIKAPLLYQDKAHEGVIHVHKNGQIDLLAPLKVTFLDQTTAFQRIPYQHPKAEKILQQATDLLRETPSGKRLLDMADEKTIDIQVISSPNYQAVTTNKPLIYLLMPAEQHTADYHQALQIGGALRDAEQTLGGYPRPSKDEPPEIYFGANYDKNLNLLMEICKITEDFIALNMGEALAAMRRLGIEDIYSGYKNNLPPARMLEIYIDMMTRQGFIQE